MALKIFHVSSEKNLFDQGKLLRLTLPLNMEITLALKKLKLCYQFYQDSNSMNCHQTEGNMKLIAQNIERKY